MTSTAATAGSTTPELSEEGFDVLRAAVNLARNESIRRADALVSRLKTLFPGKEAVIKEALAYWAHYEVSKGAYER